MKKMTKKIFCFLFLLAAALFFRAPIFAASVSTSTDTSVQQYYKEQYENSGAAQLPNKLPEDTKKILHELGVDSADQDSIKAVTPQNYFQKIISVFTGKLGNPLRVFASAISVVLLCALLEGLKLSFGEKPLGGVVRMVGTLCVCTLFIQPIVSCISDAADVLKAASTFLLACVPVLSGIMVAAGQSASAGAYHMLVTAAGNVVSSFASFVLVPLMNIFLALSIVSSISPGINLNGFCSALNKVIKWIMGLGMTLFTGLVTMHSVVASSADTTGIRTAKFVVGSFVPVVGSALGEALNTVSSCIKTLKAGVGAFGLLAGLFLFLPILAECVLWILTLTLCSGVSQIFNLDEITGLLKASADVVSTLVAILLCCMAVLIITTVVMLTIGGAV